MIGDYAKELRITRYGEPREKLIPEKNCWRRPSFQPRYGS